MKKFFRFIQIITGIHYIRKLKYEAKYYLKKYNDLVNETWTWIEKNCNEKQIESYLLRRHLANGE